MADRGNPLAKVGLGLAVLLALVAIGGIAYTVRNRTLANPAEPPPGPRSGPGWEIRYNAALALARRGSDQTPLDLLAEMLDEDQQRRNARLKLNQADVPDEAAARTTVLGALDAVVALHRQQPKLKLGPIDTALAKLEQSPNIVVRTEALKARNALAPTPQPGE